MSALIEITLSAAVPLWIEELKRKPIRHVLARAQACAQVVAEKGDVLQFRGKRGESAAAFNGLAEGLACLAFAPGGVRFMGMHFEAVHPARLAVDAAARQE